MESIYTFVVRNDTEEGVKTTQIRVKSINKEEALKEAKETLVADGVSVNNLQFVRKNKV